MSTPIPFHSVSKNTCNNPHIRLTWSLANSSAIHGSVTGMSRVDVALEA